MTHDIPPHVKNSTFDYLVGEYVRLEADREMIRDHYFRGKSIAKLSDEYDCSQTHVKDVLYGIGDPILKMASEIDSGTEN